MSAKTLSLITNTLNPSLLDSTHQEIGRNRCNQGFATDLMIIADDANNNIQIRQSALIVLKNMIYDHANKQNGAINMSDYQVVKGSIVDALARQWGNKLLVPTLRQIIYLIAQMDYPQNWPQILPILLTNITQSSDFHTVASSVQGIKALASRCSHSITNEVTLNNLCNKVVIPLFELANKLFANYTPETQSILVSIFKIFNLTIFYHLPLIFVNNVHSLMVFCKKIVDLQIPEMNPLKISCLKILSRLYSRHASSNVSYKNLKFAQQFHKKYSIPLVQSFIMQLMDPNNEKQPQIINLSLNCLTSIYKNDEKGSQVIDKYHQQILQFCLERYKMGKNKNAGQSVGSFITFIKEERCYLVDFVVALFGANDKILGDLIQYLNKGDQSVQELVLYLFSSLSQQIQQCPQLHQNMCQFIISYILPILSGQSSPIMKSRGCQIISSYKYLNLPETNLQQIFQFIYSCLTEAKDPYLNIYALEAFTQLICKYDQFMALIVPYLHDILKVYTSLMKESNGQVYEVIKSFELFLGHIDGKDIKDCAVDLVNFLTNLFYQYNDQKQNINKNSNQDNSEDDDNQDQDLNPINAKSGCLACIRQILAIDNLPPTILPSLLNSCILPILIQILSDKDLLHFEQGLNILNLCLYKSQHIPQNFQQFFKIFTYAIIGVPNQLASVNLQEQYKNIIVNVCVDPDQDLIENVIGFFRNFIAKGQSKLRDLKDQIGVGFMDYLFLIVEDVQQCQNNDKNGYKYRQNDRSLILTIYISLLQYQFLHADQFEKIITTLTTWYSQNNSNQPASELSVYIEILLVCMYYNPQWTVSKINVQWFMQQVFTCFPAFKYQYQLQRVVLGLGRVIEKQIAGQDQLEKAVRGLPQLVFRLISQRIKQQNQASQVDKKKNVNQEIDAEEQAEEDLIGQNTHLGTFLQSSQAINRDKQKQAELNAYEQAEWDEQYNKFYHSPLLNINQLEYLTNVLKNSPLINLLAGEEQQKLTQYIFNAPAKQGLN